MITTKNADRETWIDVAKSLAVFGAILQHVVGYVYNNRYISKSVIWAVALFVLIGGYNTFRSYDKRRTFTLKKRLTSMLAPYLFASAIYVIYNNRYFDASEWWTRVVHFLRQGHYYMSRFMYNLLLYLLY